MHISIIDEAKMINEISNENKISIRESYDRINEIMPLTHTYEEVKTELFRLNKEGITNNSININEEDSDYGEDEEPTIIIEETPQG